MSTGEVTFRRTAERFQRAFPNGTDPEQFRVDGRYNEFYVVCIARKQTLAPPTPERPLGVFRYFVAIYRNKVGRTLYDDECSAEEIRAFRWACETEGVNFIVQLLHGDAVAAVQAAIARCRIAQLPRRALSARPPENKPVQSVKQPAPPHLRRLVLEESADLASVVDQ